MSSAVTTTVIMTRPVSATRSPSLRRRRLAAVAVADHLNFTQAAERRHVTPPALTRAIQKLEEELGGPLLRRERSLTHLTDLGRMMVPHLERVLEGSEAARTTASGFLNLDKAP